ncbi:hypothetical protein L1887_04374 [Cichorium endivia]|nr:hypothetical protein L1887_04374 [Cichorium endivia]
MRGRGKRTEVAGGDRRRVGAERPACLSITLSAKPLQLHVLFEIRSSIWSNLTHTNSIYQFHPNLTISVQRLLKLLNHLL